MSNLTVSRITCARIPTAYGNFQLCYYTNTHDNKEHLAFYMGEVSGASDVYVRIHSECFTGDVLGSRRCDCGEQLDLALQRIAEQGVGVLVYLRQEGRGIGLLEKLRAYNLQDLGHDTVDANLLLGHGADDRNYALAARILEDLGVVSIKLLTNNPLKLEALQAEGIIVSSRIALESEVHADNQHYLRTKAQRMQHLLHIDPSQRDASER